jgi:glycosyltransferase 2 family protein
VVLDRLSGLWILFVLAAAALFAGLGAPEMDTLRRVLQVPAAWATSAIASLLVVGFLLLPWLGLVATAALVGHRAQPGSRRATAVGLLQRPQAGQQYAVQCGASLVTQVLSVGGLYCASRAFGVNLPAWLVAFSAAPIFLLAALPVSFGGWGTREVATVTGWAVFGIAAPQAVATAATVGIYALLQAVLGLLPIPASTSLSTGARDVH